MMKKRPFHKMRIEVKKVSDTRTGFTIIELVVVIAIMAVLSTVGIASLIGYRGKQNLKKTTDEVVAAIVGTQKRSISQDAGKRWNVRFSNTTSSGSQYIVFSGTSYATSAIDKIYGLNRNIIFSEPYTSSTFDAFFAPFAGTLPSKKIISLVTGKQDGFVGDIIMNTAGRVEGRAESGLVGYWHFDENTSTTAYDASGMGNNGTLANAPAWQTGTSCKSGSCLNFNGASVYVIAGHGASLNLVNAASISFWFNPASATAGYATHPIQKWTGTGDADYVMYFFGGTSGQTNQIVFYANAGGVWSSVSSAYTVPAFNNWYHVVWTYTNSGGGRLYVNGLQIGGAQGGGVLATNVGDLFIGTDAADAPASIDEVKIYNRALSATEILNMYNDLK